MQSVPPCIGIATVGKGHQERGASRFARIDFIGKGNLLEEMGQPRGFAASSRRTVGTVINLSMLDEPRLSVGIDVLCALIRVRPPMDAAFV